MLRRSWGAGSRHKLAAEKASPRTGQGAATISRPGRCPRAPGPASWPGGCCGLPSRRAAAQTSPSACPLLTSATRPSAARSSSGSTSVRRSTRLTTFSPMGCSVCRPIRPPRAVEANPLRPRAHPNPLSCRLVEHSDAARAWLLGRPPARQASSPACVDLEVTTAPPRRHDRPPPAAAVRPPVTRPGAGG